MGRDREGDQRDESDALEAAQRAVGEDQEMHRQHGEAGEDVGQQDAGEPRQGGQDGQRRRDAEQQKRPAAEAQRAQHQRQHPDRQRGLDNDHRPEIGIGECIQEKPNTVERLGTR